MRRYEAALREYKNGLSILSRKDPLLQRGVLAVAIVDLEDAFQEDTTAKKESQMQQALTKLRDAAQQVNQQTLS
jgi:hypothetical protein